MINNTLVNNFFILTVIITAVMIRLLYINQPLLEFFPERQTQTAEIVRNIYVNGWADFWTPKVRYFTGYAVPYIFEFPLFAGTVTILYKIFGPSLIWGRILSIISFAAASVIFSKIVSKSQKKSVVFFSLVFFVFSPLHILISRSYQPDEMALFFLLLAIWVNSPLLGTFAYLTKFPAAIFGVIFARQRPLLFLLSLAPALLWSFRASRIETLERIESGFFVSNWFVLDNFVSLDWYWSLFQIQHVWVLTTPGLIFFALGLYRGFRDKNLQLFRNWLLLGAFYFFIFNYHTSTHEYYHLFFIPVVSVFVGVGLNQFLKSLNRLHTVLRLMLIIFVLSFFMLSLLTPALHKIKAGHTSFSSYEILQNRYQYILDF